MNTIRLNSLGGGGRSGSGTFSSKKIRDIVVAEMASMGKLGRKVVDILPPASDADPNIVYLIRNTEAEDGSGNIYDEYLIVDGAFELIGNTSSNSGKIAEIERELAKKLAANPKITAGTGFKITFDENGLITDAEDLSASDIPALDASKITGGKFADGFIESAETWNNKQDEIEDLSAIRSGAAEGATALQPDAASEIYSTKTELSAVETSLQQTQKQGAWAYKEVRTEDEEVHISVINEDPATIYRCGKISKLALDEVDFNTSETVIIFQTGDVIDDFLTTPDDVDVFINRQIDIKPNRNYIMRIVAGVIEWREYVVSEAYITFSNDSFKTILLDKVSSDGVGVTKTDAARVATFEDWFVGNTDERLVVNTRPFDNLMYCDLTDSLASAIFGDNFRLD